MNIERKKRGKKFIFLRNGKVVDNEDTLERIRKLVIPPAWRDVYIADKASDKIQCIGRDDKDRKQYKYN